MKLTKEQLKQIIKEELELFENENVVDKVRNSLVAGDAYTYQGFAMTPPRGLEGLSPQDILDALNQLEREGKIEKARRGYFSVVQEGHYNFGPFLGKSLSVDFPGKETLALLGPVFTNIEDSYNSLTDPESQKEFEDTLAHQVDMWKETWQRRRGDTE